MYDSFLEERKRKDGSSGVFSKGLIPAESPIIEFSGTIFNEKNIPNDDVIQIGPNSFIGSSPNLDEKINHSCNPNCMLHIAGNRVILYSIYVIAPNNELTIDYSLSSNDSLDSWKMNCKCGFSECRKIISGYQYLDETLKESYKKRRMVPIFLSTNILVKK